MGGTKRRFNINDEWEWVGEQKEVVEEWKLINV